MDKFLDIARPIISPLSFVPMGCLPIDDKDIVLIL